MQYLQRTIWYTANQTIEVLDQRYLPHQINIIELSSTAQVITAIKDMIVRGAPLIGATAAFGVYFACQETQHQTNKEEYFNQQIENLKNSRPTAVNLFWAINKQLNAISVTKDWYTKTKIAWQTALQIVEDDVKICKQIGEHGLLLLEELARKKKEKKINILTHCNAGRLGCIEWGTATAPIYLAHKQGLQVHVWVDETRPRNQGASLTAWELQQAGIPHTVIADNTGGHLMQHHQVDICIVGTDRATCQGDIANKIGTYLKALAAKDNGIPFYVALPSTSIDWNIKNGLTEIPIEERTPDEVRYITGWNGKKIEKVLLTPADSPALNIGFDVTPARLITGLITERGICQANEESMLALFPEAKK
ncbi:MAG: S-methyl-5-thioribose-1-phosphate isomerase [Microscillaceae bacterium]|nr:S-methyl-5-thioribose-1-phosphate isomerase [Microscillaceae bacterium]MDW8461927.1 S-methyl-5-thioribose-1-phosphate isomerase [Cytophagales bacterium]